MSEEKYVKTFESFVNESKDEIENIENTIKQILKSDDYPSQIEYNSQIQYNDNKVIFSVSKKMIEEEDFDIKSFKKDLEKRLSSDVFKVDVKDYEVHISKEK